MVWYGMIVYWFAISDFGGVVRLVSGVKLGILVWWMDVWEIVFLACLLGWMLVGFGLVVVRWPSFWFVDLVVFEVG